jgi:excisionase family DNA binding protein
MASIPFHNRLSATIAEACEATGVGRTKLYELIKGGRIETRKIGTRTLVLIPSLLAAIDPQLAAHDPAGTKVT